MTNIPNKTNKKKRKRRDRRLELAVGDVKNFCMYILC